MRDVQARKQLAVAVSWQIGIGLLLLTIYTQSSPRTYILLSSNTHRHRFILSMYLFFWLCQLCQRRKIIKVIGQVTIKNGTIVFCHVKRRMPHEPLQPKCIASTINKIFPCKGVTEKVYACLLDSSCTIIMLHREPQSVF